MTIEELKMAEGLTTVTVYHAKDSEGNCKYDSEGNPLYKFVGERMDGSKPLFGYVSKNLGRKIEVAQPYNCEVKLTTTDAGEPLYMVVESTALATW